jgi:HPt (histidine-containing phosphotransfer) domain-containing protein
LSSLQEALARGDRNAIEDLAHSWKGTSGLFGARRISLLCSRLERLAHEGDLPATAPLISTLEKVFQATSAALRSCIREEPAGPLRSLPTSS